MKAKKVHRALVPILVLLLAVAMLPAEPVLAQTVCLQVDGEGLADGTPIPGWDLVFGGPPGVASVTATANPTGIHSGNRGVRVNGDYLAGKEFAIVARGVVTVDYWHYPKPGTSTNSMFILHGGCHPGGPDAYLYEGVDYWRHLKVWKNDQDLWWITDGNGPHPSVASYSGSYTHIVITIDTNTGLFDLNIDGQLVHQGTVQNADKIGTSGIRYVAVHSGRGASGTDSYFDDILITATETAPTSTPLQMVSIPGGVFQMGDHSGMFNPDELPVHSVTLSPFSMSAYEITCAQWEQVKNWAEAHNYTFNSPGGIGNENHPVTHVEWYDAALWCNALSEMEGRTPCYYTSTSMSMTTVYRSGRLDIQNDWVDWTADGYRLPTEAEWEYACRAGTTTLYSFGDSITGCDANYQNSGDSYDNGSTPVGSYAANAWGLYDMHGNVWEWCWDWYDSSYYNYCYNNSPVSNPKGPDSGSYRVPRVGGFQNDPPGLRSANRESDYPDGAYNTYGFRPVSSSPRECAATATDTGVACFTTSNGTIEDLTAVATPSTPPAVFPHGMFSFKITGLSTGQTVTLTVELPDPVPAGTKWWKYHNNTWSPMDIGDDDGDNVITVALQDGRTPDDEDLVAGQITDQGGPGSPGSVGWETHPVNKVRVLLPWIVLAVILAGGAGWYIRRRGTVQS